MFDKLTTRLGVVALMLAGVAVAAALVVASDSAEVWRALLEVGWGALAIVGVRAAMIAINGIAWGLLVGSLGGTPTLLFVPLRWMREAVNVILPVANVGGEMVAARVLTFWRVPLSLAVAGVLADVLLQTAAQALFTLVGAVVLMTYVGLGLLPWVLAGVAVTAIALGGFYLVQRHGGLRLLGSVIQAVAQRVASRPSVADLHLQKNMNTIWRNRSGVVAALFVHLCAWSIGTLEVWIALHFMGWSVPLDEAMIIESLGAAISSAAFFIPGSWGVQEGGYILVGQFLGIPPQAALALSLAKRIPDIVLGVPGLIAWQLLEMRRAVRRHGSN